MNDFRVLIVEDTTAFQQIYGRAVERLGGESVLATSYEETVRAVERLLFHVAVVDVCLSEADEANVDGLKVLDFVREVDDGTQCILITGYGTFQIARDAIEKHRAFRTLEKKEISPASIAEVLSSARQAFMKEQSKKKENTEYSLLLKPPDVTVQQFQYNLLSMLSPEGGATGLFFFYDTFLGDLFPLRSHRGLRGCVLDRQKKLASGLFWSKAAGFAVLLGFGSEAAVKELEGKTTLELPVDVLSAAQSATVGEVLKGTHAGHIFGLARALKGIDRSAFD